MKNIYTFGHSARSLEEFRKFLNSANIDLLVDIRLRPQSQYQSQFNRANLEKEFGDKYMFAGNELGGSPKFHNDLIEYISNHGIRNAENDNKLFSYISETERQLIFSKEKSFSNNEKRKEYITRKYLTRYIDGSRREKAVQYLYKLFSDFPNRTICFFCSEKNPLHCHRYYLLEKDWLTEMKDVHIIRLEETSDPQGRLL